MTTLKPVASSTWTSSFANFDRVEETRVRFTATAQEDVGGRRPGGSLIATTQTCLPTNSNTAFSTNARSISPIRSTLCSLPDRQTASPCVVVDCDSQWNSVGEIA